MPYVKIKIMEGRTFEKKQKMVEQVTNALVNSLDVKLEDVRIEILELKEGTFAYAGKLASKKTE
ncbi:MAG TPA: 2-hydroxymuconate tautomerase family protein [Ureibacillus sp.]|nr:2-hydroxymuconate tautomerase family protein [Ureibacillus sp.]